MRTSRTSAVTLATALALSAPASASAAGSAPAGVSAAGSAPAGVSGASEQAAAAHAASGGGQASGPARIDLNTAGEQELIALPGIGPAKARAIVETRRARPFRKVEDLLRVRGIGRKTFLRLREQVTVGRPAREPRAPRVRPGSGS